MSQPKGLMRSLGEFVGHIARAVRTDPAAEPGARSPANPGGREVRRQVQQQAGEIDGRRVTLRRTIIEEVRFEDDDSSFARGSVAGGTPE